MLDIYSINKVVSCCFLFPDAVENSARPGPSSQILKKGMANKKVRAGHRVFLTRVIEEAEERLQDEYAAIGKAELLKWKASLKEQFEKILPLHEQILAELGADEKVTEEEVAEES